MKKSFMSSYFLRLCLLESRFFSPVLYSCICLPPSYYSTSLLISPHLYIFKFVPLQLLFPFFLLLTCISFFLNCNLSLSRSLFLHITHLQKALPTLQTILPVLSNHLLSLIFPLDFAPPLLGECNVYCR